MPATTTNTDGTSFLHRVYAATTPKESRAAYDEWAATFDQDMQHFEYVAPTLVAAATANHLTSLDGEILDAGCGSGAVGIALAKLGAKTIDGVDYSAGMLEVAGKTHAYRRLWCLDLTRRLEVEDASYSAVVCCGTLTHGHVGPSVLREFVRIIQTGGIVVATVLEEIWASGGYLTEVENMAQSGLVHTISTNVERYRAASDVTCRMVILRKL